MSSELEKVLDSTMKKLVEEYMEKNLKKATSDMVENLALVFTYKKTLNLVKHSKTLSIWTIVIGISTVLLFISAVIQLITLFFCP